MRLAISFILLLLAGCSTLTTTPSALELATAGPFPFQVGKPVSDEEASCWPPLELTPAVSAAIAGAVQAPELGHTSIAAAALGAARRLESAGDASCVDYYYLAAAATWPHVNGGDSAASSAYHKALAGCLQTAQRFGRLDARSRLLVNTPRGAMAVPTAHGGFVWRSEDFDYVALVGPYECEDLSQKRLRPGVGAPLVVFRRRQMNEAPQPEEAFLVDMHPFAATAVLRAELAPFLPAGNRGVPAPAEACLEFFDPLRVASVALSGASAPLAADFSAPLAVGVENPFRLRLEVLGFVQPGRVEGGSRLSMLEPYRPGAVPLVLVHGLLSSPMTWADMVNELRMDERIVAGYQIWAFRYSTGDPFLKSAAQMREALRAALAAVDPGAHDAALNEMVLAGHSMGGLLSRLQITGSEDRLWRLWSKAPLESLKLDDKMRAQLHSVFFFAPQPFVSRVIYLGTPHCGSNWATSSVGSIASAVVTQPDATNQSLAKVVDDNPHAFSIRATRLIPTSIDMLAPGNPMLVAMASLPQSPRVKAHSIIGDAAIVPFLPPSDGVVPVASARIPGVESELIVPARHTHVHRHPFAIAEVRRILAEHLAP
jgi:hypothetical protein